MSTTRRVAQNSLFLFLGDATVRILGLLLIVYLARYMGPAEYGRYAFAISFGALFLVLSDMGLSVLAIREIARDKSKAIEHATAISLVKLILSVVMFATIAIIINILDYPRATVLIVYVVALINIFASFSTFFRSIFRAFEKMHYDALTLIGERIIVVSFALVLLFTGHGLMTVVLAMLVGQVLGTLITVFTCISKFVRPPWTFDIAFARTLFLMGLPLAVVSSFDSILFQTDTIMLSKMQSDNAVGLYNAAYRPIFAMLFIPTIFVGAIFPTLSRYFVSSKSAFISMYQKSFKLLVILAIPLGLGTTVVAQRIISFLYTAEYDNSAAALQILVWTVSLIFLNTFFGYTLVAINRQRVAMIFSGVCALLSVILNLILIPIFSYEGAACATVGSQAIIFVLQYTFLQKQLTKINLLQIAIKPLIASLLMGVGVSILDRVLGISLTNLIIIIIAAIGIYGLVLFITRALDREETEIIQNIFSGKFLK